MSSHLEMTCERCGLVTVFEFDDDGPDEQVTYVCGDCLSGRNDEDPLPAPPDDLHGK